MSVHSPVRTTPTPPAPDNRGRGMLRHSDPGSSVVLAGAFVVIAATGLFLGVRFYLPVLRPGRG